MGYRFVTSDHVSLYYRCKKYPRSPFTLIFLHGLGGNLTAWAQERRFFHHLKISTYALDLRGHGASGRPTDSKSYNLNRFALDINEFITENHIKNPVLIGHCFGGIVSINAAALNPQLYRGLVLIDTDVKPPWFATDFVDPHAVIFLADILSRLPNIHLPAHVNYQHWIGTSDWDWPRIFHDILHTSLKSYLSIINQLTDFDLSNLLNHLTMPTLIISGQKDTIFPPQTALALKSRLKHADFSLIKDANHILVINQPTEISNTIKEFLDRLTQIPA